MPVKDYEGLIFREIRDKVLNEVPDSGQIEQACIPKSEVTNHIKISIFSGLKLGLGIMLGSFIGMIVISIMLLVTGVILTAIAGSVLNIDVMAFANIAHLTSLGNM